MTGAGHEWWYHWKADELKRACPGALVPTLIPIDEVSGEPDESKVSVVDGDEGSGYFSWQPQQIY